MGVSTTNGRRRDYTTNDPHSGVQVTESGNLELNHLKAIEWNK